MENLSANEVILIWLIFGAICIGLEAMAVPGVGFLFTGLAAITVGGLLNFDLLPVHDFWLQVGLFFGFTFLWAVALWAPLLRFRKKNMTNNFNNVVGDMAIVESKELLKNKIGKVRWSGTILQARLDKDDPKSLIKKDEEVVIKSINGTVVTVGSVDDEPSIIAAIQRKEDQDYIEGEQ